MEERERTRILEALKAGYNLPALSPVALKLVELAADDRCSARDLANLIEKDPSLAVRLLKIANSAFFKMRVPVSTLEQAVVKLGFHRLRIMGLSLSLRDTFPMGRVGPMDYEGFWRSSLYRALIAKSLARHFKTCQPEEAFVAALVLEIGLLIFFDLFIRGRGEAMPEDLDILEQVLPWEESHVGLTHRQVGEIALRFWRFPESILACQRAYGDATPTRDSPPLPWISEQARSLAALLLHREMNFPALFKEANRSCDLDSDILNDILLETFRQVQDIADQLRLAMDGEKDLLELLERANYVLGQISYRLSRTGRGPQGHSSLPSFEESLADGRPLVGRTLQAVAHEIRNPLTAVGGFARRLVTVLEPSSEGGKYARFILEETLRLERALHKMNALTPRNSVHRNHE